MRGTIHTLARALLVSASAALAVAACGHVDEIAIDTSAPANDAAGADAAPADPDADADASDGGDAAPAVDAPPSPVVCGQTPCAIALAAGTDSVCAVMSNGTVRCWGSNLGGMLGRGTLDLDSSSTPGPVVGLTDVVQISGYQLGYCVTRSNGSVACWGKWNSLGDADDGGPPTFAPSPVPHTVAGVSTATGVFIGEALACATLAEGDISCWGYPGSGLMPGVGYDAGQGRLPPSRVNFGGRKFATLAMGHSATVGRTLDGSLVSWGANVVSRGNGPADVTVLGRETSLELAPPAPLPTLPEASFVANGYDGAQMCAASKGRLYCWGASNLFVSVLPLPIQMNTSARVQTVQVSSPGGAVSPSSALCATFEDGKARCIGDAAESGQGGLGNGSLDATHLLATDVLLQGHAVGLAGGGEFGMCALIQNGTVMCWGRNDVGQLGTGATDLDVHATPELVRFDP